MRQVVPAVLIGDYAAAPVVAGLWGNIPQNPASPSGQLTRAYNPVEITIVNFRVNNDVDDAEWQVRVDDVPVLTATSLGGVAKAIGSVVVPAFSQINYYRDGPGRYEVGSLPLNATIEWDTADDVTSWYACCSTAVSTGAGGAFGPYGRGGTPTSNVTSVSSLAGTITKLTVFGYFSAVDAGKTLEAALWRTNAASSWLAVELDGSGGTPDTRVSVDGDPDGWKLNSVTLDVDVAVGESWDVNITEVGGADVGNAVGYAVVFEANETDRFMLCGSRATGDNNFDDPYAFGSLPATWKLTENEVDGTCNIGGVTTLALTGLVSVYSGAGWPIAPDLTLEAHVAGAVPATSPIITLVTHDNLAIDTDPDHVFTVDEGQVWTTKGSIAPSGINEQAHWSYAAFASAPVPPSTTRRTIRRLRQFAHISDENFWLFWSKVELIMESGVGLTTGQGSDPQVMISWSNDGGHTWSTEHWVSAGPLGQYKRRVILRRLGRSRDRVWRIVVTDPVKWVFLEMLADIQRGTS